VSLTPQTSREAGLDEAELAAWRGFLRTYAVLVRELDADLRAAHGLSLTAYELLRFLDDAPDGRLRPGELSAAALLTPSGITRLCDRLERDGLIAREECEDDGRGSFVALTAAGRTRARQARATHLAGVRARFLAPLSVAEIGMLGRVWQRVAGEPAAA
jgi:DNA-binding MarR family transcriptional regulator